MRVSCTIASVVGLFAAAFACGGASVLPPTGQLVIYVGTDAPLPAPPGSPPPAITPLFDRIRISVFKPKATTPCEGCVGEFAIDSQMASSQKISFGVVPQQGVSGYVARIDMFRAVATQLGEPIPQAAVTQFIALPTITADGIVNIGVFLSVGSVGTPQGSLSNPTPALKSMPQFDKVGTWPGAAVVPCSGTPKPQEVCVPGGAFWMGNPQISDERSVEDDSIPHLVVLSPFYIDSTEVTVGTFRAWNNATIDPTTKLSTDPMDSGGDLDPSDIWSFCTYTTAAADHEDVALNCISWQKAHDYCQAQGASLVTEAQFEYVASGRASNLYVWGNDPPSCADAVWGRGGVGAFSGSGHECNLTGRTTGPLAPKNGALDQLIVPGGGIVYDLTGNVSEWTADKWNRITEPCWNSPILTDPLCGTISPADGDLQSIRGGAWPVTVAEVQAPVRNPHRATIDYIDPRVQTGLRCARPGH